MEEKKKNMRSSKAFRIGTMAASIAVCLGIGTVAGAFGFSAFTNRYKAASDIAGSVTSSYAGSAMREEAKGEYGWAAEALYDADNSMESAEYEEAAMEEPMELPAASAEAAPEGGALAANSERKLIYTYNLTLETLEFDALCEYAKEKVLELGGYIESESLSGSSYYYGNTRNANLTIRIPSGRTEEFTKELGQLGSVRYSSSQAEDITLNYVDTKSRLEALRAEQTRLMELLEQAETTGELLEIEKYVTDVRYQIQSWESQLRTMDNQVSYDTLYLNVNEVEKITPVEERSFVDKIKDGFADNLSGVGEFFVDLVIFLITSLPLLLILLPAGIVIYVIIRVVKKRKKKADPS